MYAVMDMMTESQISDAAKERIVDQVATDLINQPPVLPQLLSPTLLRVKAIIAVEEQWAGLWLIVS